MGVRTMILVMNPSATGQQVERACERAAGLGLEACVSRGQAGTLVAVRGHLGDRADVRSLATLPGVDGTVRLDDAYGFVAARPPQQRSTIRVGPAAFGPGGFTFIAGPCAVESATQATVAWQAAQAAGATMLRGDIFKHRTSPYSFQGLGREGVKLLAEQRRRSGLPLVAEVLHVADIDVLAGVVDVLRIGSRNMQNRELLRACGASGKPVMLKRGLSATIEEWLLAAETIAASGNLDIILCERGIRTFEPATRNTLDLSAVTVAQQRSHLPVVVDPSHATGRRGLIAPLALAAVAAGADGVMVDVHPQPDAALCDGPQALQPSEVVALGASLRDLAAWMRRTDGGAGVSGDGNQAAARLAVAGIGRG